MKQSFEKFRDWLKDNCREGFVALNPPATEHEVEELRATLGFDLPNGLVEILAIHNGQNRDAVYLFDGQEFLSSHRIVEEWKVWKDLLDSADFDGYQSEPQEGIKDDWWNEKWIPFTYNGFGDHYCIDLDPAGSGVSGQVITMWHDMGERELLAPSFSKWFDSYVAGLYSGKFVFSDEQGAIVNKNDL